VVRSRRREQESSHLVDGARLYAACLEEIAVLGIMQLNQFTLSHVANEMRDALLLKGRSIVLPSPEEAGAQFGVRINGDVGGLLGDKNARAGAETFV
jgi:hypothetical protein